MILRATRRVYLAALVGFATFMLVMAIDKNAYQFFIGPDADVARIAGNMSALEIDQPKTEQNQQEVQVKSDGIADTYSHAKSDKIAQANDAARAADAIPSPASSEIECSCAHKLMKLKIFNF